MNHKKYIKEMALNIKEKYLTNAVKKAGIGLSKLALGGLIFANSVVPSFASSPATVDEYLKQKNYDIPTIFQLYLNPLNENGLSEKETQFLDSLVKLPEEKREDYAKSIFNNKELTGNTLEKIKKEAEGLPAQNLEQKLQTQTKTETKPQQKDNPVDIYAVIAVMDDAGENDLNSENITYANSLYWLLKSLGTSDNNIDYFMYRKNTKDIINTDAYYFIFNRASEIVRENAKTNLPHNSSDIKLDYENFDKEDVLRAISNIKSDENDYVYILLDGHGTSKGKIGCASNNSVGWISGKETSKSIKSGDIKGTIILYASACYSERFIRAVGDLNNDKRNYVGIASCTSNEMGGLGSLYNFVIAARDNPRGTVEGTVKEANKALSPVRKYPIKPNVPMVIYPESKGNILFIPPQYTISNN
jgi:hypothetical protein